jgi:hypothetical protein
MLALMNAPRAIKPQVPKLMELVGKAPLQQYASILSTAYKSNPAAVTAGVSALIDQYSTADMGSKSSLLTIFWEISKTEPKKLQPLLKLPMFKVCIGCECGATISHRIVRFL